MNIQFLVTRNDFSLANLEREFSGLGLNYDIEYIEEHPELVSAHTIRHSPNILVNGSLAFRHQPTVNELKTYLEQIS